VALSTRVSERCSEQLRAYAKRAGRPLGEVLDEMVAFVGDQPAFEDRLAGPNVPEGPPLAQHVIDMLGGGLAVADADLVICLANQAFRDLLGDAGAALVGERLDRLAVAWAAEAGALGREIVSTGRAARRAFDGGLALQGLPLHGPEGATVGVAMYVSRG
jgi:hypothetical protein